MSPAGLQIFIATLVIIGAIAGAFLGYWLGLRRYRFERWWERKADIYTLIFDALNDFGQQIDLQWREEQRGSDLTAEQKEDLHKQEDELQKMVVVARTLISKQARIGSFILSKQSEKNLGTLLKELSNASKTTDWFDFLEKRDAAIYKAIDALKESARADLKT